MRRRHSRMLGRKNADRKLTAIVDKISPAVAQAKTYAKPDGLLDAAIRENVHRSAADVLANSDVLRHAQQEGRLTVIEAVYELDSGEVVRLATPVDSQ